MIIFVTFFILQICDLLVYGSYNKVAMTIHHSPLYVARGRDQLIGWSSSDGLVAVVVEFGVLYRKKTTLLIIYRE